MLNRIVLIGRNVKDPDLRYTPNGVAVSNFTIAVDRSRKDSQGNKQTDFFDCIAWRQLGELVAQYTKKGSLVAVDGEMQTRTYETQDGQKRKVYEVIADNVRFLSPKDSNSQGNSLGNEINFDDDTIPF